MPSIVANHPSRATLAETARRIGPHIHRTPLLPSRILSEMLGARVFLKAELFQRTGSYKPRGMLNRMMAIPAEQRSAGAVTFSAGNAAQGLAYAAGILGMPAIVVMPRAASPAKVAATRGYGAEVLFATDAAACYELARAVEAERGATFVPSYDDDLLMTGHATLGIEVMEEIGAPDLMVLGCGGGGMSGGLAMAMLATGAPTRLVAVEPTGAPAMSESLKAGRAVKLTGASSLADGLAAPAAGERCFALVRDRFEAVVLVEDKLIAEATLLLMSRAKLFAEPAGAAGLAGLMSGRIAITPGSTVVVLVSGGNIDPARLRLVLDLAGEPTP
jgi:threonine dehydratase